MASYHLSSFLLLLAFVLLLLSPQIHAREGKFFSFFSHFTTTSHHKLKSHPPSPSPSPSPSSSSSSSGSIAATPESSILGAPAPSPESTTEASPVPSPAESEFVDRGDGYGLYGTTSFENNNDNRESFKTGFGTKLYSNYNNNNEEEEEKEQYRNSYKNNNKEYYSNNHRSNNYYVDSYYSNNNNNNNFYENNNRYNERKREGMSDTRFVENGKYFYDLKGEENQNDRYYNVNGYEPTGRGSTTKNYNNYGGSYYENNNNNKYRKYPNEFDTMEEYEKQQENQGYVP